MRIVETGPIHWGCRASAVSFAAASGINASAESTARKCGLPYASSAKGHRTVRIVVFGATGSTGSKVVERAPGSAKQHHRRSTLQAQTPGSLHSRPYPFRTALIALFGQLPTSVGKEDH